MFALSPARCLLCRQWARLRICPDCMARHAPPPAIAPRCPGCGIRLALGVPRCAACVLEPMPQARTVVAVDYVHPWDRVLPAFKFGGCPEHAPALAQVMARAITLTGVQDPRHPGLAPLVLPVPLSAERLARRGFNQAWELARPLARTLGLQSHANLLQRTVDLPGQAQQDRQARLQRLRGVFQVPLRQRTLLAGRAVALVDDVLTTGATAAEAVHALMTAGAGRVEVWALARTPAPAEEAS